MDSDTVYISKTDISDLSTDDFDHLSASNDEGANEGSESDVLWHEELSSALNEDFVDHGIIKFICKCRVIPKRFRAKVWKLCLNITNRSNSMLSWDSKLDLEDQADINSDCQQMIDDIKDEELNKQQILDDIKAVVTFYCKSRAIKYKSSYQWMHILKSFAILNIDQTTLYNCFYAIQSRYIPRSDLSQSVTNAPYNLLRLLLLYHDPELCNFLDTCKITPEMFTRTWFSSLFSAVCDQEVTSALWDIYFQKSDPFFILFLSLVILVNAKEQVITGGEIPDVETTVQVLSSAPSVLSKEDVDDFCQLASYYSDRTPSSFRRDLAACFYNGAMVSSATKTASIASDLQESFCLKISIPELLLSSQPNCDDEDDEDEVSKIRYFLVDCRPAEQYNQGHLLTAFHLDATLMLRERTEFDEALTALFAAQEQAIQACSTAGGEHLCFIGSGDKEKDQYMYMVVANLLQKRKTYISVVRGGYASLFTYLEDVGINISEWIVGNKVETTREKISSDVADDSKGRMESLVKKMAGNFFQKSLNWKDKITKFIENTDEEWTSNERSSSNSSSSKKESNENVQSVFCIDDEDEANYADDEGVVTSTRGRPITGDEIAKLSTWTSNSEMKHCFECKAVQVDGLLETAYLYVTATEMRCLLEVKPRRRRGGLTPKHTWVRTLPPRLLRCIARITSRRSFPELITFKFGDADKMLDLSEDSAESIKVVAVERYILVEAGTATKAIKQLIVESDEKWQAEKEAKLQDIPSTS